jgi:hypothetical protein
MALTQERLKELLDYDPETGIFTWRGVQRQTSVGTIAGSVDKDGYIAICVDYSPRRASRLAWLWMTGEWPSDQVDHKDRDRKNNRFSNLRLATGSQNQGNRSLSKTNKSGFKGVSRYRAGERSGRPWQASIRISGKSKNLGYFSTREEAHAAYCAAATAVFGEFARTA